MELRKELRIFAWIAAIFVAFYFLPLSDTYFEKGLARFDNAVLESLALVKSSFLMNNNKLSRSSWD